MRILFRGQIGSTTGFSRDGVGIIRTLMDMGHEVTVVPTAVHIPVPTEVASLLRYGVEGIYDLEIHHVPPTDAECSAYHKQRSRKVVLWTMWEWFNIPDSVPGRSNMENIKNYDHVVLYTDQTKEAFSEAGLLGEGQDVSIVQGGFEPGFWKKPTEVPQGNDVIERRYVTGEPFIFAMVGHLSPRKNALRVINAFNRLKIEHGDDFDALLVLKTSFPILPSDHPFDHIRVINEKDWTDEQLRYLYWKLDCLINVSYGEGKDLPSMEATMCGVPTILNDTPGHKGWVHPAVKKLIGSTEASVGGYRGLRTSEDQIMEAMMDVYSNRRKYFKEADDLAGVIGVSSSWNRRIQQFGEAIGIPIKGGR